MPIKEDWCNLDELSYCKNQVQASPLYRDLYLSMSCVYECAFMQRRWDGVLEFSNLLKYSIQIARTTLFTCIHVVDIHALRPRLSEPPSWQVNVFVWIPANSKVTFPQSFPNVTPRFMKCEEHESFSLGMMILISA